MYVDIKPLTVIESSRITQPQFHIVTASVDAQVQHILTL